MSIREDRYSGQQRSDAEDAREPAQYRAAESRFFGSGA
jgi:hypothetical protein